MKIKKCRSCGGKNLKFLFSLGKMSFTGKFAHNYFNSIAGDKLTLVICEKCKLVQLDRNFNPKFLYSKDYGYRTGINKTMTNHVKDVVREAISKAKPKNKDYILDIASNDGTLLKTYGISDINYVGIDPTIKRFKKFYPKKFINKSNFFTKKNYLKVSKKNKAKCITSIAVFYDIIKPNSFVSDIKNILKKDGIWVMEQSYLPILIKNNGYDSICHEHLTYFTLKQIDYLCKKNNLRIIKTSLNKMYGGSIRVFICHKDAKYKTNFGSLNKCKRLEKKYINMKYFYKFKNNIVNLSIKLNNLVKKLK